MAEGGGEEGMRPSGELPKIGDTTSSAIKKKERAREKKKKKKKSFP